MAHVESIHFTDAYALQEHNRAIRQRIRSSYLPKPAVDVEAIMAEMSAIKAERDQYRAMVASLKAENLVLSNKLDRFTNRLSNLQRDAIIALEKDRATEPVNMNPIARPKLTIDQIIRAVCDHYGKHPLEMLSHRRTKDLILPRHVAMYLCKEMTMYSVTMIGRKFAGRDHTTVLHACRKVSMMIELMPEVDRDIKEIKQRLINSGSASRIAA